MIGVRVWVDLQRNWSARLHIMILYYHKRCGRHVIITKCIETAVEKHSGMRNIQKPPGRLISDMLWLLDTVGNYFQCSLCSIMHEGKPPHKPPFGTQLNQFCLTIVICNLIMMLAAIVQWRSKDHVCFIGLFLFYRDISFLCDATTAQKKTTLLPPLTDRSSIGDAQVSCLSLVFDVIRLKMKTSAAAKTAAFHL